MDNILIKIKSLFVATILVVVLTMTIGGYVVGLHYDETIANLNQFAELIRYKAEYAAYIGSDQDQAATTGNLGISTSTAAEPSEARAIPVMVYHGIIKTPDWLSTTKELFKDQMFALK